MFDHTSLRPSVHAGEYSITPLTLGSGSLTSVTATYVPPLSGEELGTLHFSTPSAPANFVAGGDTSSLASGQSRVYLYFKDMLTFPAVGTCRYQLLGAYIASKLTGCVAESADTSMCPGLMLSSPLISH